MSYMKEIDIQVRETIEAICGVVARYFPESEFRAGDWEHQIELLVYDLAEKIIQMWRPEYAWRIKSDTGRRELFE